MQLNEGIIYIADMLSGWVLMGYVGILSVCVTLLLRGIQIAYVTTAFRLIFCKKHGHNNGATQRDMTPLQAFINTLSTNLGNGTIAGMATAIYAGGPGAAVWFLVFALLLMSVRYAEVFVSALYGNQASPGALGGPMLYLKQLPLGKGLAFFYALLCLLYGLIGGGAVQANSIRLGLENSLGIAPLVVATVFGLFVLYVGFGGAARVVKISNYLVPIKVGLFFGAAIIILLYHIAAIPAAVMLMIKGAIDPQSISGALAGVTLQNAIQYGLMRSVFASESGLGTAAILFGSTGKVSPAQSGLMGMMSTLVSGIVCFILALCIVVTGVWNSGLTSTALTVAAFTTTFGSLGGYVVSLLSIIFGLGVTVSYAYIVRACWLMLTGKRWTSGYIFLYAGAAFFGAIEQVALVWRLADIVQALMLFINLYAILYFVYRLRHTMLTETHALSVEQ